MSPAVAFVAGGTRGLGLSLVRALCQRLGEDAMVYLGARDEQRGRRAVEELTAQGLHPVFCRLDVRDPGQVRAAAAMLRKRHGGVDIVLSNAALRRPPDVSDADTIRAVVDTSNHGTHHMIEAFTLALRDGARFVVVASAFGRLQYLREELRPRFEQAESLADLAEVLERWVSLVEAGTVKDEGWQDSIDIPSKVAQVAAVRLTARRYQDQARRHGVLINAACPGQGDAEATAADVAWLATLPAGTTEPYGELVQHRVVLPFTAP